MNLTQALPTKDAVLQLEPEELGSYVLGHFGPNADPVHRGNFVGDVLKHYQNDDQVEKALMEAWSWLIREGLFVEKSGGHGWCFISRRGQRLRERPQDFETFRRSNILPKQSLHPVIAERVWSNFIRGEYDTQPFFRLSKRLKLLSAQPAVFPRQTSARH